MDLNNVFISRHDASSLVQTAERDGFPSTCCAWIKGIYGVLSTLQVREVIGVVRGDCSQTQGLLEILQMEGIKVFPFSYPYDRARSAMGEELAKMRKHFQVDTEAIEATREHLSRIRVKLKHLDTLTWKENRVSGEENKSFLLASSDMKGDPFQFETELDHFLDLVSHRTSLAEKNEIRLGVLGVPPIWTDFYKKIERKGVRVVFNEVPRQFSMPITDLDLAGQYLAYTYPYDVFFRLEDIQNECTRRDVDGVIHYVQSFCFRQIEDKILRKCVPLPILTLEGDRPEPIDMRTEVRLEAFLEMLARNKVS